MSDRVEPQAGDPSPGDRSGRSRFVGLSDNPYRPLTNPYRPLTIQCDCGAYSLTNRRRWAAGIAECTPCAWEALCSARYAAQVRAESRRALLATDGLRDRVRLETRRAVRAGKIAKPAECSECGEALKLYAHHDDYTRPLEIVWLCGPCHGQRHVRLAAEGKDPRELHHRSVVAASEAA
jgi:ribosomal protein S27AE